MADPRPNLRVVSAEIVQHGRYLITQRQPDAVLGGLWEFPGGRVRPDESDATALRRALQDRVGVQVQVGEQVMEVVHDYEGYVLTLAVYLCEIEGDAEPEAKRVAAVAWVGSEEFGEYAFPGADQKTVDLLVGEMEG